VVYRDDARGAWRGLSLRAGRLHAALYVARTPVSVSRAFVTALLGTAVTPAQHPALLAGRGSRVEKEQGPLVCSCRQVGVSRIQEALAAGHDSVSAIANLTGAGSQCGGCRIDVQRLIDARRAELAR
jgi:assimilatory nitrate reductase catalytic subunit